MNENTYSEQLRVICTRPRQAGEEPHWNEVSNILLERTDPEAAEERAQTLCTCCGMQLILQGRYVPIRELGHGGFGRTFLALDCDFFTPRQDLEEQQVKRVIKQFSSERFLIKSHLDRAERAFVREKNTLADLKHEQIPQVYACFKLLANIDTRVSISEYQNYVLAPNDRLYFFYLVQEYVEGQDLHQELIRRLRWNNRYTEDDILRLLRQLLPVIQYIHTRPTPVIHRDIKPANIVHSMKDEKYYLVDFGAVKQVISAVEQGLADDETGFATIVFAPPEQHNRIVSFSSDLYSLAVTCISLLTGKTLTGGNSGLEDIRSLELPYNREKWKEEAQVSPGLAKILNRMLEPEPENRYSSAVDVLEALMELEQQKSLPSPSPKSFQLEEVKRWFHRRWRLIALAVFTLIFVLTLRTIIVKDPITDTSSTANSPAEEYELASVGNRKLFSKTLQADGTQQTDGTKLFVEGDFDGATAAFKQELKDSLDSPESKLDPETLIYLNNAIVRSRISDNPTSKVKIAVTVTDKNQGDILLGVAHAQSEYNCDANSIQPWVKKPETGLRDTPACPGTNGKFLEVAIAKYRNSNLTSIPSILARDQDILSVIGAYTSDNIEAVSASYKEENLVVVSPSSNAVRYQQFTDSSGIKLNDYVFRLTPTTRSVAKFIGDYVNTLTVSEKQSVKLGVVSDYSVNGYSKSLQEEILKLPNSDSLGEKCDLNPKSSSFKLAECTNQIKAQDIDVLVVTPTRDNLRNALEIIGFILTESDFNMPRLIIGSDTLYDPPLLELYKSKNTSTTDTAGQGKMLVTVPWARGNDIEIRNCEDKGSNYEVRACRIFGTGALNWRMAMAYDSAKVILAGLEDTMGLPENNPRKNLRQALSSNFVKEDTATAIGPLDMATGKVSFDRNGDRQPNDNLRVWVEVFEDNQGNYNFQKLKADE